MAGQRINERASRVARTIVWIMISGLVASPSIGAKIHLETIAQGLERPVLVTNSGDGEGRIFIVQQVGRILVREGTRISSDPFLDISDRIYCCDGERGLMSMAFHPEFTDNGYFYVGYSDPDGDSVISRFSVSEDPSRADPESERVILSFDQPGPFHNNGHVAFGPDGMLYIGSGDGGGVGDPNNNGQNLRTLHGALLRIDVDADEPYAIPPDNPFVGEAGAQEEIWVYGLRNPWRFSFDRLDGDLFIGDVGQDGWEEVDYQEWPASGGANYGWRRMEGDHCFEPPTDCGKPGLVEPILEYSHDLGCSVTGGHVYRGSRIPRLYGVYLYGDFCTGRIWGATREANGEWLSEQVLKTQKMISSFGEDQAGEVYLTHYSGTAGSVARLAGKSILFADQERGGTGKWSQTTPGVEVVSPGLNRTGYTLRFPVDGTSRKVFVKSLRPSKEDTVRLGLYLHVNEVDLGGGEVVILQMGAGKKRHVELRLRQRGNRYFVHLGAKDNRGGFREIGRTRVPRDEEVHLQVEWSRASAPGTADGLARLFKFGQVKAEAGNLANDSLVVSALWLGLPSGSEGSGATGHFLVDEVALTP